MILWQKSKLCVSKTAKNEISEMSIDTNIWIRILLRGRVALPILAAFNDHKFQLFVYLY